MDRAISRIVAAFGGVRPFAKAIERPASTVQYWPAQGFLPRTVRQEVLDALVDRGVERAEAERLVEKAIAGLEIPAPVGISG